MRGKPRKGVLRHSNHQFSEFFQNSENLLSLLNFQQAEPRTVRSGLFFEASASEGMVFRALGCIRLNEVMGILKKNRRCVYGNFFH